jgi:hypothetical protein
MIWIPDDFAKVTDVIHYLANLQGRNKLYKSQYIEPLFSYTFSKTPACANQITNNRGLFQAESATWMAVTNQCMMQVIADNAVKDSAYTQYVGVIVFAAAEQTDMQALAGYEKALGPGHTSTLNAVQSLGILYRDGGKLAEAERMFMWAGIGQ